MTALALGFGRALRGVDAPLAALVLAFAALAVAAPDQAAASARFVLANLWKVAPFLLASVALAAASRASGADNLIARAFQGNPAMMVVLAAAMGALSPFCSCGVIPLIAALLTMGVPLAPVMAFWLASPLMDPSMFVLTAGTLGFAFAVAKTAAAVGIGLLGGFGTLALMRNGLLARPLREGVGGAKIRKPKQVVWRFWAEPERRATFLSNGGTNLLFLGQWLALAFLLESLMVAWVPNEAVAKVAGGEGLLPVVLAALVGIPAYLNGYAALPLVGGLIEQGMAPGAGMAFLLAGGVTSVPAAMAVWALARPPVFAAYLGFALVGAVASGLLFGWLV
ncbi:MAG: permease [Alphaproteobacteria bacterium]|nr:permease [Alphaproteobacteria bacterium]MBF0392788.1 permease [Alphaproteobacteria bacterium]